jgi:hypothetical protein
MTIAQTIRGGLHATRLARSALAMSRASDDTARTRARRHLANLMADARGISAKLGQWMAADNNDDALCALCDQVPAGNWEAISGYVTAAFGSDWQDHFKHVENKGHGASLGQVHRALLHNGRSVAIKVQYHDVADSIQGELRVLGLIPGIGPIKRFGINIDGYRHMLHDTLASELDYCREAKTQMVYRLQQQNVDSQIIVPGIHDQFTRTNILVQDWEGGDTFDHVAKHWSQSQRNALGTVLVRHFCRSFFINKLIHADPHSGNYRFRWEDNRALVVLYDFGCTATIPDATTQASLALITSAKTNQHDFLRTIELLVHAGFDEQKLQYIGPCLPALAQVVFAPFLASQEFDCRTWEPARELSVLLGDNRWWFRSAGPPSFLWLMRAYAGLVRQIKTLNAQVNWAACLQHEVPQNISLPLITGKTQVANNVVKTLAKNLCLRVERNGEEVVALEMPVRVVDDLPAIMEGELLARLHARGINVQELSQRVQANGYQPGELFSDNYQDKMVRVWLS